MTTPTAILRSLGLVIALGSFNLGCAHPDQPVGSPVCTPYASAYEVLYQDGVTRKAEISACSDGQYSVKSLDAEKLGFRGQIITVRLVDIDQHGNREFYFTVFNAQ